MIEFFEEAGNIYRLKVPFEAIYTSVFLIKSPGRAVLVDCATTGEDVDRYILPALKKMGYELSEIDTLVLTHAHADHAGGLGRVLELAPKIKVVTDVCTMDNGICTYAMAGHTEDCIGVLDMRSYTLISGDGLQGAGVDKYRCSLSNAEAYLQTLKRIENDPRIENILFSHAYEPLNQDCVHGREAIVAFLSECKKYINGETK